MHIVGSGNESSTLQNHSYVRSTSETTLIVALSEALPYPVPSTTTERNESGYKLTQSHTFERRERGTSLDYFTQFDKAL